MSKEDFLKDIELTPEQLDEIYRLHKERRNKRVFRKFGVNYPTINGLTEEQRREQNELHQDLLQEQEERNGGFSR